MTWIQTIDESQWNGELAELRIRVADPTTSHVDNIMAVHAIDAGFS